MAICKNCEKIWPWSNQCVHMEKSVRKTITDEGSVTVIKNHHEPIINESKTPTIIQAEALQSLANSISRIADFLSGESLPLLLGSFSRAQIAKDILGGLAAHGGRGALDSRTIKQNAIEIAEIAQAVFAKFEERLADKGRDPEIKEPQE